MEVAYRVGVLPARQVHLLLEPVAVLPHLRAPRRRTELEEPSSIDLPNELGLLVVQRPHFLLEVFLVPAIVLAILLAVRLGAVASLDFAISPRRLIITVDELASLTQHTGALVRFVHDVRLALHNR